MKRLVTLGITLALVMGLFCFSVNAENIVIQGESDTVTATYGSNDVTIALRARKLRVINTGTAAAGYAGYTPVIVSITIYNLGNQNCLVNNLKFRLTSESAEYRIAGYENISPDLFISDTAYDATGYLSLKAANEYTYAGGFIVPANTNMTYVGIINVSANWITENQTWRTVDLSTATFYENMTTTIGDYSCNAEPVDLSYIETNIDSLLSAVQGIDLDVSYIPGLLQSIINSVSYTGSNPTNINEYNQYSFQSYDLMSSLLVSLSRVVMRPYYLNVDFEYNSTSDSYGIIGTKRYPFIITLQINNNTGTALETNYLTRIQNYLSNSYNASSVNIDYFYSDIHKTYEILAGSTLYLPLSVNNRANRGVIFPGFNITVIQGFIDVPADQVINFDSYDENTLLLSNLASIDGYYPKTEYEILRDLYIAYSSVNGTGDLSDQANEAAEQAETIHNQEASYYAQNQAAIEATGLSNFQFSGEQSNGIGSVSNDFTALWNALGSWNSVYIFSMTLTLALTILRHMPNRRRPKEDKKE